MEGKKNIFIIFIDFLLIVAYNEYDVISRYARERDRNLSTIHYFIQEIIVIFNINNIINIFDYYYIIVIIIINWNIGYIIWYYIFIFFKYYFNAEYLFLKNIAKFEIIRL